MGASRPETQDIFDPPSGEQLEQLGAAAILLVRTAITHRKLNGDQPSSSWDFESKDSKQFSSDRNPTQNRFLIGSRSCTQDAHTPQKLALIIDRKIDDESIVIDEYTLVFWRDSDKVRKVERLVRPDSEEVRITPMGVEEIDLQDGMAQLLQQIERQERALFECDATEVEYLIQLIDKARPAVGT